MMDRPFDPLVLTMSNWLLIPIIIVTGLAWATSQHGSGMRKLAAVALGGAIALGLVNLLTALFPSAVAVIQ